MLRSSWSLVAWCTAYCLAMALACAGGPGEVQENQRPAVAPGRVALLEPTGVAGIDAFPVQLAAAPPPSLALPRDGSDSPGALQTGRLLIAKRNMASSLFSRTVILLVDYGPHGAVGVILNRPTDVALTDLFPTATELQKRVDPVYLGGPVSAASLIFLIRGKIGPPDSVRLFENVHVSGSSRALEYAVEKSIPASRFHSYMGYAGWGPQQLDMEVRRGDWWIAPATAEQIFEEAPDELWERLTGRHEAVEVRWRRVR